eukprot:2787258-Rhodomonas_salina.1
MGLGHLSHGVAEHGAGGAGDGHVRGQLLPGTRTPRQCAAWRVPKAVAGRLPAAAEGAPALASTDTHTPTHTHTPPLSEGCSGGNTNFASQGDGQGRKEMAREGEGGRGGGDHDGEGVGDD